MSQLPPLSSVQRAKILADGHGLQYLKNPTHPNVDPGWVGGYRLGGGSYGEVSLWIMYDPITSKALKYCAIKDAFDDSSTQEEGLYRNIYHQLARKGMDLGVDPQNEIGQAHIDNRYYKEAYLQGMVTEPDSEDPTYCVPLWGYARKDPGLRDWFINHWRLYMPLYEYGTLETLIDAHLEEGRGIPEPFIWHTLHCLMSGAEQLRIQAAKREGATSTDIIVVFDMKPVNILLAPPDQNSTFPMYPRPHIADLGGACLTNNEDPLNRQARLEYQVTAGYRPPEVRRPPRNGWPCGRWTNIWQIGRVAEALMKLQVHFDDLPFLQDHPQTCEPQIMNWQGQYPGQNYSYALRHLVSRCMKFNPIDRAHADKVLWAIKERPDFRQHFQHIETFGSDAWFEEQQRQQAEKAATEPPKTTTPAEIEAANATLARQRSEASAYLRAWDRPKREKFLELGVFPDDRYNLNYTYAGFWADPFPVVDENGAPRHRLDYGKNVNGEVYLKGHTGDPRIPVAEEPSFASDSTAVEDEGDDDVDQEDVEDVPFFSATPGEFPKTY
ncbi:hypothetical protein E4T48_05866 [Aureobasidium sp. EXF-10727]|nr:hypothetical protein E4T48_05866 [Aureobasidium sp. EXF-10727]